MNSIRSMSTQALALLRIRTGEIHDNAAENRFCIPLNATVAEILYEKNGGIYDLVHTNVPKEYEGHGLGTLLAERVFDHLVEHNCKIKLTCEFLQHFYSKNKAKYQSHVIEAVEKNK